MHEEIWHTARSVVVQYVSRRGKRGLPLFAKIADVFVQYADIRIKMRLGANNPCGRTTRRAFPGAYLDCLRKMNATNLVTIFYMGDA